jgi:hypothetical protein
MRYFIWNLPTDPDDFSIVRNDVDNQILRQGWGCQGMSVSNSLDEYVRNWPWAGDHSVKARKYQQLKKMLEIEVGDLILVKGLTDNDFYTPTGFTIVRCTVTYDFSPIKSVNDFGHFIKIEKIASYKNFTTETKLGATLWGYRYAIIDITGRKELTDIIDILTKQETIMLMSWM